MSLRRRHWPAVLSRPASGWSSLLLLLGMLVVVGAGRGGHPPAGHRPAGPRPALPLVAILAAGLVGFLLARSRIGVLVRAHLIGAVAGAVILLLSAAASLEGGGAATLDPGGPRGSCGNS